MTRTALLASAFAWGEPAGAVLAALRNRNGHTRITNGLSEPLALDIGKGGNVAAVVADEADRRPPASLAAN